MSVPVDPKILLLRKEIRELKKQQRRADTAIDMYRERQRESLSRSILAENRIWELTDEVKRLGLLLAFSDVSGTAAGCAAERDPVSDLRQVLIRGSETTFRTVPVILNWVLVHRLWTKIVDRHDLPFTSFRSFAEAPLWHGLETKVDDLLLFCRDKPEVRDLLLAELASAEGIFA